MHIVHTLGQAKNFSSGCGKKRRLYGGSASRSSHGKRRSKRKTFKSAERRTIAAFRQGQAKSRIEETVARDCVRDVIELRDGCLVELCGRCGAFFQNLQSYRHDACDRGVLIEVHFCLSSPAWCRREPPGPYVCLLLCRCIDWSGRVIDLVMSKTLITFLNPTATLHRQVTNAVCYGSFMVIMPGAQ